MLAPHERLEAMPSAPHGHAILLIMKSPSYALISLMASSALALTAVGQEAKTGESKTSPTESPGGATAAVSPSAARADLESLFKGLDTNGDGVVTREEFLNGSAAFADWTRSHGKKGTETTGATDGETSRPQPTGTTGSGGRGGAAGSAPAGAPGSTR